ncbi:hypothetical protein HOH15_02835 [Candidatus Woesearchaeota archaeon]|nr:hypothetical protein [Candidatus Woesearchaeota archaeon]
MKKRGVVEVQFNWIFIFIVGTIILMFFIFVGKSYLESSNVKLASKVRTDLDSIMKGATSSTKSASKLEIPRLKLSFTCYAECSDDGCSSDFSIGDTGVNKETKHETIFSIGEMKTDFLITWTLDWSMPFKVTNFLYLTNPSVRYILVYQDDTEKVFAEKVYHLMLDNDFLTVDLVSEQEMQDIENWGHKFVRFVFFYPFDVVDVSEDITNEIDFDVVILPDKFFTGKAILRGYDDVYGGFQYDDVPVLSYYTKEMLIGIIFSKDAEFYQCNMIKSFNSLNRILDLYSARAYYLAEMSAQNPNTAHCAPVYAQFIDLSLSNKLEYPLEFTDEAFFSLKNKLGLISETAKSVNKKAIVNSCPRLY